ncbi:hypothetical protein PYCC9005_000328 [Savitreella phatthalungensis]
MQSYHSPYKRKRGDEAIVTVSAALAQPLVRPIAPGHNRKRSTVVHVHNVKEAIAERDNLAMQRHELLRIFNALETCLLSDRSLEATYHSLHEAVASTSRTSFELQHLAKLLGIWPDAYTLGNAMALYHGERVPSISIAWPAQAAQRQPALQQEERRSTFRAHLDRWTGAEARLPELIVARHMPINEAKVASIRKTDDSLAVTARNAAGNRAAPLSHESAESKAARQDALLDRIRARALSKSLGPSESERQLARLRALTPQTIASIKVLLASRPTKAIGMKELVDNLVTSLRRRLGAHELTKSVELLALDYPHWCKIGSIGDVTVVRFAGTSP